MSRNRSSIHFTIFIYFLVIQANYSFAQEKNLDLQVVSSFHLGQQVGSLRAVPVQLSPDEDGLLVIYSADKDIDPFIEMFYPPTDQLKLAVYSLQGNLIWRQELATATLNGIWFTPVFPFDLNEDGTDEIYFVNNIDTIHVLSHDQLRLTGLDARNGKKLGEWPWKRHVKNETLSHTFRNFIMGGYVDEKPVLVTGQGTYAQMGLNAWNPGMKARWELLITADEPGPRGSHMSPIVDINLDGNDDLLWGERCISLNDGKYLFIADKDSYKGHSDVIQPTLLRDKQKWIIFTCRESGDRGQIKPRVVMYDDQGQKLWSDLELGHMDMGWTAHVNTDSVQVLAYTISRGGKKAGPGGFFRYDVHEFIYDGLTGKRIALSFPAYNTIPVDLDGDGYHEFARAFGEQADRNIYDLSGNILANLGESAYIAMASKFMNLPGEQLLCYYPDGQVKIFADRKAKDSRLAKQRFENPYYKLAQKQTANGYNYTNLGGL